MSTSKPSGKSSRRQQKQPGPYNSAPPAGGVHYDKTLPARFYEETDVASLPEYPEGYLVHNLEHGHIIIWYNCDLVDEAGCAGLKEQIREVMDEFDGLKVVAFPWKSLNVPVVMTSWDRTQRFESFNPAQARAFIHANRNRAPESQRPVIRLHALRILGIHSRNRPRYPGEEAISMIDSNPTMFSSAEPRPSRGEWLMYLISRHWILVASLLLGGYAGLPFLAPVFMQLGWSGPGRVIYFIYSFLCHQLPQRSYFLFGSKITYSLPEIQAVWQNTLDPLVLRQFIGNPEMGWKVAWSDRMVSMFTSLWLFGMLWWPLRRWIKPLPWWGLILFLLPMAVDGTSHLISDLAGIGQGFRDSNAWLAGLTDYTLPLGFYAGDALGSFNSLMRLLTGLLLGLGIVWFGFPYLDDAFSQQARFMETRLNYYPHRSRRIREDFE